jgi:hypothetical protein
MPQELAQFLEPQSIFRTCSCTDFHHYARCIHVIVEAIATRGRQIVPRGEDTRVVGSVI